MSAPVPVSTWRGGELQWKGNTCEVNPNVTLKIRPRVMAGGGFDIVAQIHHPGKFAVTTIGGGKDRAACKENAEIMLEAFFTQLKAAKVRIKMQGRPRVTYCSA